MIHPETIERAIDVVVAQCAPEQVFVIGSYATHTAKRTSDLDLLIVAESAEDKQRRDERVEHVLAPLMIPVDVNVYTPREFAAELAVPFSFARTATELQGKLVYSRTLGDFAALHRRWDSERSGDRHARVQRAPGEWQVYQAQYARTARAWTEPPWAHAAAVIARSAAAKIADLGCGDRTLAHAAGRELIAVDHVACDETVIAADLAQLPLATDSVDIAVMSLALIGANWRDALQEAARITMTTGCVLVTELIRGPRSISDIAETLASRGWSSVSVTRRGPFVDVEARRGH